MADAEVQDSLQPYGSLLIIENRLRTDQLINHGEKSYKILGGQNVLLEAKEEKDMCCRQCACICTRDWDIEFETRKKEKEYTMTHETMCCSWCSWFACCRHRLTVFNRKKDKVGYISQDCKFLCNCYPSFTIYDEKMEELYEVTTDVNCMRACCGPACTCCGCVMYHAKGYTIEAAKGKDGNIDKLPEARGAAANEDTYQLVMPENCNPRDKILFVGATLLVDYALYDTEYTGDKLNEDQV